MIKSVIERYQAPLSAALLLTITAVFLALVILPLVHMHRDLDEAIVENWDRLTRYQAIIETESAVARDFERLKQQGLDRFFYPSGSTPASVAGELQKGIKALIEKSGGTLTSAQVLRVDEDTAYPKVGVRVNIQSDMQGVRKILHGIEAATPLLFAEGFMLKPLPIHGGRARQEAGQIAELELDVYAYQADLSGGGV